MFFTLESHQFAENASLIDQMYRLRAQVFHQELSWDVKVENGREIDDYDRIKPVYLMWTDKTGKTLLGSLRIMPTTGPTLLYDVFRKTFPSDLDLSAPGIWEGTRLCVNQTAIARELPDIDLKTAFCRMLLALCEVGVEHGIHTIISNYEPPTKRLYQMAGAPLEPLGKADGFGRRPVCAGSFRVTKDILLQMRVKQGVLLPLLVKRTRKVTHTPMKMPQIAA